MHHSVQIGLVRALRAPAALAVAALPAACILPNPGFIAGSEGEASATESTSGVTTEADTDTATTTTGMFTTGMFTTGMFTTGLTTGTLTTEDPTTSSTSETTTASETSGQIDLPATCAELLDKPGSPSGLYDLADPGDPEVAITVYCDLEIAGGGWLLAGRSHPTGGKGTFGWHSTAGSVDDDAGIYSLNLLEHPFPFTEVLIGDYSAGKTWGDHVYRIGVPEDLVTAYPDKSPLAPTSSLENVTGTCTPDPSGMFQHVGYTTSANAFLFRDLDHADEADYGLVHDQIYTLFDNCEKGGLVHQKQGMIMVR